VCLSVCLYGFNVGHVYFELWQRMGLGAHGVICNVQTVVTL